MRRSPIDRLLPVIPAILLATVALLQIWRVHTLDQSSWTGAGFGMFARIDNEDSRFVRIQVETPDGSFPVPLPAGVVTDDATAVPDESVLSRIGQKVLDAAESGDVVPTQVSVELWGVEWVAESSTVKAELLAESHVGLDDS